MTYGAARNNQTARPKAPEGRGARTFRLHAVLLAKHRGGGGSCMLAELDAVLDPVVVESRIIWKKVSMAEILSLLLSIRDSMSN